MLRDSDRATNCNKSVMSSDTDRSNHKQEERADGYLMFTFLICILPSVHTVISTTAWLGNFKVLISEPL